jgi:hypothetical protein
VSEQPLTPAQATEFLQLPSVAAFYAWRRRHRIPNAIEGRSVRVWRADLLRQSAANRRIVDFREDGRLHGAR